ncbi:hypothetical protein GCM10027577_50040 [Spirosoma fluminis]
MKLAAPVLGQSAPSPKAYTYLIYHKLSPGLTIQDALLVEKEWRTVNQAAVDEGNMIGWYMLVKQMSSNTNPSEYDYVTVIVTPSMGIKGASPAGMSRVYGDSVKTRMADLQKRDRATAPVVKMEIWETVDAVFSPGFTPAKTPLVAIDFMRLRDPAADWTSLVAPMKRQAGERVQNNTIAGWDLSTLVVPNGSEKGYSLIAAQSMATMDALANRSTAPNPEQIKLHTQQSRTFEVVRQEVFRIMEFTTKPSVPQATK